MATSFTPPPTREMFAPEPLSVRLRRWRPDGIQRGVMASLFFHLVLLPAAVLGWERLFGPIDFSRVLPDVPMQIVLVNGRTQEAPTKAQVIAQAQLAGGGEAAADGIIATSPLMNSPVAQAGDAEDNLQRQIDQSMQEQEQLLTRVKSELASLPQPDPRKAALTAEEKAEVEHRKQMMNTLAAIEKTIREQNSRPRRRFVSPSAVQEVYAIWGDQLRQRIEQNGTRHFPMLNHKPLHGSLYINIVVDWRGRVLEVKVVQGSGIQALDQRAVAIAREAGPFEPFTPAMRLKADELEWSWHFVFGQEGLSATPSSGG